MHIDKKQRTIPHYAGYVCCDHTLAKWIINNYEKTCFKQIVYCVMM